MKTLDEIEEKIRTLCGSAPTQDGGDVEAACDIAMALVGHVRALARMTDDRALERITALEKVLPARADLAVDRITALEEKVAALGDVSGDGERWGPKALDRLRAVAEERDRLSAENAELRKRVAELEKNTYLGIIPPEWPAPQPIETAPLGEILAGPAPNGFAWAPERPLAGCSLEHWRTQLREAERRWWLPVPPPGGGK